MNLSFLSHRPPIRKHVGLLPSERREQKRLKREGIQAAAAADMATRKHKGELPSERRERERREREARSSGLSFTFGPSCFPSTYDASDSGKLVW